MGVSLRGFAVTIHRLVKGLNNGGSHEMSILQGVIYVEDDQIGGLPRNSDRREPYLESSMRRPKLPRNRTKKNEDLLGMKKQPFKIYKRLADFAEQRACQWGQVDVGSLYLAAVHFLLESIDSGEEFDCIWNDAREKYSVGPLENPQLERAPGQVVILTDDLLAQSAAETQGRVDTRPSDTHPLPPLKDFLKGKVAISELTGMRS
jgi:hypothetical protein